MLDIAVIDNALAKLRAVQPVLREREVEEADLARARAELAAAKVETNSLAAERDHARADLAGSRAELVTVHAGLAAGYKELDRLERQQKKGKV